MTIHRRIKFIWGASKVIRGHWYFGLFGLYHRREGHREDGLAISVRGLLIWGALAAAASWVALATAGFWIWQRNPYSTLTYTDALCYPLRREAIARKKGQAYIAQGRELARLGRWGDAANLLRLGLARVPEDLRGRMTLALFYQLTNQHVLAMKTLTEGLGESFPGREYVEELFRVATLGENFGVVVMTCNRLLPQMERAGRTAEQRWLIERRHGALMAAGRQAEALVAAEAEAPGAAGREERRVAALLALGRSAEARAALAEWARRPGANRPLILRLEARACREARQFAEMEQALAELRRLQPAEPAPLVYAVVQQTLAGRTAEAQAAFDDFLFRFGGFADHLVLMTTSVAELGHLPLVERCVAAARERGFAMAKFDTLLLDALLANSRWDAASQLFNRLPPPAPNAPLEKFWREWIQALIEAVTNPSDAPQSALVEALRSRVWAVGAFRRSAEILVQADRLTTARDVLEAGVRAYPASATLQTKLAEVREKVKASEAAQAAARPVPPPPLVAKAKAGAPSAAPAAKVAAKKPAPVAPESLLEELRQCRMAGDQPGVARVAREYLTGDRRRAEALVALARDWAAAGDRPAADLLLREVLRKHEAFPPARRLLAEFEAAAAKPK